MSALLPSQVLDAAADLIEPEGAWQQGSWFDTSSELALGGDYRCMCAEGALILVGCERFSLPSQPAHKFLLAATGAEDVPDWNDAPERTQAEVVAALRKAADLARSEGQ